MYVSLFVRMNAEISETIRAWRSGFGMQIPEFFAQRKFVSARCHAHFNAHKPTKTVAPTVLYFITIHLRTIQVLPFLKRICFRVYKSLLN